MIFETSDAFVSFVAFSFYHSFCIQYISHRSVRTAKDAA
jgi:hypothetical protein